MSVIGNDTFDAVMRRHYNENSDREEPVSLKRILDERNAAMLTMDEAKIRAFAKKHGIRVPSDPLAFWGGIHKARCQWTECPAEARAESEKWLAEHGMPSSVGEP